MESNTPRLIRAFLDCFAVFWILFTVFIVRNSNFCAVAYAVVGVAVLVVLGMRSETLERVLTPRRFTAVFAILFLLYAVAILSFAYHARIGLPSDTDIVYDSIADLLADFRVDEVNLKLERYYPQLGLVTNADYFCRYPNNIALLLILSGVYVLTGGRWQPGTVEGQTPALAFSAVCVLITVLILCYASYQITRKRTAALFALLASMSFQAFYFSTVNFYTDVIVLPFAMGAIALMIHFFLSGRRGWLIGSGVVFAVAACIKITALIFVVAGLILLLFLPTTFTQKIKAMLSLLLPLACCCLAFYAWIHFCGWFEFSKSEELHLPWQLWICYGSRGSGYNYEETLLAVQTPPSERSAFVRNRIFANYSSYSLSELYRLQLQKLAVTWNDSRFDGATYALWPVMPPNWTYKITQGVYPSAQVFENISKAHLLILYFFTGGVACSLLRLKSWKPVHCFCLIGVFGVVLYLQLFETAARRALLAMPVLLLLFACAMTSFPPCKPRKNTQQNMDASLQKENLH